VKRRAIRENLEMAETIVQYMKVDRGGYGAGKVEGGRDSEEVAGELADSMSQISIF